MRAIVSRAIVSRFILATVLVGVFAAAAGATFPSGRVSLDLRDADVRDVLWAFAKEHQMNVIIGQEVQGTVTLTVRNVPVSTAFRSILDNAGLGYVESGGVMKINSLERLKTKQDVEPLVTEIVKLNYFTTRFGSSREREGGGSPGDREGEGDDLRQLQESLKEHLSGKSGSSITVVPRTNSLVITDIASNVGRLVRMAKELDVRTPQVLIEARIVEVDADYSRNLGITTTLASARTENTEVGGGVTAGFPGRTGTGGSGALDFFVNSIGGNNLTDLQIVLNAAESNGLARTLATPRVTTLNNKEAVITSGQRIPFTTIGSIEQQGGTNLVATVEFVDAALELAVTPHVTHDGNIMMRVRTSRNTADFTNTVFQNPTIQTREARNEVLVADGETILIGGIYTQDDFRNRSGVPFLQDVPVLGHLFRSNTREKNTVELIFLITPRVVGEGSTLRPEAQAKTPDMRERLLDQ